MQQLACRDGGQLMQLMAHTTQDLLCIQRYRARGSMKESVRQMRLSYGRYHKHAGQIVAERKLRRDA
jgi:hypothetical protein